ncbi:MAG: hypothetical protein P8X54_05845 [Desulfuromonadales bacterium]
MLSLIFILLFFGLAMPIQADSSMVDFEEVPSIRPETTNGLQAFFQALDYNWAELEEGVPPLMFSIFYPGIVQTRYRTETSNGWMKFSGVTACLGTHLPTTGSGPD